MIKKILLAPLAVLLFVSTLPAAEKIRIGFPEFNSSTFTLPMAQIKGFFHEEGLQAELIRIRSAVALPALTSGEIDYHTVVAPAVTAALRGIPVRVVACFTPGLTTAIIARSEIKTVQDLKGKTIGLNSIGGGLETGGYVEDSVDLDKDANFLATGGIVTRFALNTAAWRRRAQPGRLFGKKFRRYMVLARAYDLFSYPNTGLVASLKKIKESPDQLKL